MSSGRAQTARDLISAVLILIGTAVLTWGAWQIDRAAGGITGGVCLLLLGVALGFGEVGERDTITDEAVGPNPPAANVEGLTPPDGVGAAQSTTSSAPAPSSPLPPDPRPTAITLPASRWIGVNGELDGVPSGPIGPSEQRMVDQLAGDLG